MSAANLSAAIKDTQDASTQLGMYNTISAYLSDMKRYTDAANAAATINQRRKVIEQELSKAKISLAIVRAK